MFKQNNLILFIGADIIMNEADGSEVIKLILSSHNPSLPHVYQRAVYERFVPLKRL